MGKFQDTSIKKVVEAINDSHFLPDIQREYVWLEREREKKIEQLFDSLLKGYPIGSFLFWQLKRDDIETDKASEVNGGKLNFQLYKFLENYDPRNSHNEKIDISKIKSSHLSIVLDGQQRLTSLYIGLRGSRWVKKPRTNQYAEKKLYINLRYTPGGNADEEYQFEFKTVNEASVVNVSEYWFKVGEILEIKDLFDYWENLDLGVQERKILSKLQRAICLDDCISYYSEEDKNLDKVLNIFIRVNSGGTKLSYSDLLMSILTANFARDIRAEMNVLVDGLKDDFSCFGRDHILKTCLLLVGSDHKFLLQNFSKANIAKIESGWERIVEKVEYAVSLVKDMGYQGCLSSGYIITAIAYYLHSRNKTASDIARDKDDRDEVAHFIRLSQIRNYFSSSSDSRLSTIKDCMKSIKSFKEFNDKMRDNRALLPLSSDDIEDIVHNCKYGDNTTLPILQMLYPNLDYKNRTFHIDHIYPKSKFNKKNLSLADEFFRDKDYLFNLQLMEGSANISKKDSDPCVWLNQQFSTDSDRVAYKERNYIAQECTLEWEDFATFKEKRISLIKDALLKLIK